MKKILCLMLAFALCFSMYGTAEENAGEEAVSNIVTYGPVSFDISDKWVETKYCTEEHSIDVTFNSTKWSGVHFWIMIKDSWHADFSEDQRTEYELEGFPQEEFDFVEVAESLLQEDALDWPMADPEEIEAVEVGEYDFCRLIPHFLLDFNNHLTAHPAIYYGYINGYLIALFFFGSSNFEHLAADFEYVLNTLNIGIVDKIP